MSNRMWAGCALVIGLSLAACSNGGLTPSTPPTSAAIAPHAPAIASPHAVLASGNGSVTATGTITALFSGGFTMNEGSTGYVHVYTTSSTTIAGAAPYVGEAVEVTGSGSAGTNVNATSVAQQIVIPPGVLSLTGAVSNASPSAFTVNAAGYGYTRVTTNVQTVFDGAAPANGAYAQAVGPGSTSETAAFVASWASPPPSVTASGTVTAATSLGFTLNVDSTHPAVRIVLASSTKAASTWPVVVSGHATVTGAGSTARSIVAASISAPSPTPAPTPTPGTTPTPTPVHLAPGAVIGQDNRFNPPDGDTSSGGQSQTVDGMPCAPSMSENAYHVHAYVGILVNGTQIAVPDQIGLYNPGPIQNGVTNTAQCYYYIHTHDASGMIHIESPSTASLGSSIYTLGNLLDVWGITVGANNVGPFTGQVRIFYDRVPLKTLTADTYTEYTGTASSIPLYSHEAIWLEVGPTFVLPPKIPAVEFYTEY